MKRVVITGLGITSCIGNDKLTVLQALKEGRSGITFQSEYQSLGMRSQVAGVPEVDFKSSIDRKALRFMGDAAGYAYLAMQACIDDSQLTLAKLSDAKIGIVAGSGGASSAYQVTAADLLRSKGIKKVGPYMVTRTMSSTVSACLAAAFKIKGVNYSLSSACATSTHCIGHAMELIQLGKQDLVFAGGGEEIHWTLSSLFDGMGALSSAFNDTPEKASRPFDAQRDGFVIAGGGGMLAVESLDHALARNAPIYAELVGYGRNSDGDDMVAPSGEGAIRCMQEALEQIDQPIDYINVHGTSTQRGDLTELKALQHIFGEKMPPISSTKSMTGHSLGATGVHEAIYCLLMMQHDFIAPSINIDQLAPEALSLPIVQSAQCNTPLKTVLSNNFGFGGTNASLVFQEYVT